MPNVLAGNSLGSLRAQHANVNAELEAPALFYSRSMADSATFDPKQNSAGAPPLNPSNTVHTPLPR
jgi:hypothetical protein